MYNVLNWGDSFVVVDYKKSYALNLDILEIIGYGVCDLFFVMYMFYYCIVIEFDGSCCCVVFLNEVDWRVNVGVGITKVVFYEFDE